MNDMSPVTIADVASAAGVSRAAVSKVIRSAYGVSDAMRERVQAAIDDLGYRPNVAARSMRGPSYTLGFEIPSLDNPIFDRMIAGAMVELEGTPYQVIVAPTGSVHERGAKAVQALADRRVDGIITVSAVSRAWLECLGRTVPVAAIGSHEDSVHYDTIADDDPLGAALVIDHLADLGHRRIAHLTVDPKTGGQHPGATHVVRAEGYRAAMQRRGLEEFVRVAFVNSTVDAARQRTLELLDSPDRPTAVFAGHDQLAMGVLAALADRGLTADDVSVVGYDDSEFARHPLIALTSVDQFANEMGRMAVRLLMERISGRIDAVHPCGSP